MPQRTRKKGLKLNLAFKNQRKLRGKKRRREIEQKSTWNRNSNINNEGRLIDNKKSSKAFKNGN